MDLIVDSCVIIGALVEQDSTHEMSREFFATAAQRNDTVWAPATALWDVSARFVHPKGPDQIVVPDDHGVKLQFLDVTSNVFFATQAPTHLRLVGNELRVARASIRGPDHVFLSCALLKVVRSSLGIGKS
jgi:hypothetical protein